MATFTIDTTTLEAHGIESQVPWSPGIAFKMSKVLDFSDTDVFPAGLIQNATCGIFSIPAFVLVTQVIMNVITAQTTVTDVDVGAHSRVESTLAITAVDVDGFIDGGTLAATGIVFDADAVLVGAGTTGMGYIDDDPWFVSMTNIDADTISTAKVEIICWGFDLRTSNTETHLSASL